MLEDNVDTKTIKIDKIDKIAPTAKINKVKFTKKSVTLEVETYDELSGIDSISFNGGKFTSNTKYTVTKAGKYYVQAKDKAGNVSEKSYIEVLNSDFNENKKTKTFKVELKGNGTSLEKTSVSCITTENSCQVMLPKIITRDGGEVLGWSTSSNAITATYESESEISINQDLTLYAITRKTNTVQFYKNGADTIGAESANCIVYNGKKSCTIETPIITRDGGEVLGWSTNSNATTATYKAGSVIGINQDVTLYAITSKTYTATFFNPGLSYLEFSTRSCKIYNKKELCNIILPEFNKSGHFNGYWSTDSRVTSNLTNQTPPKDFLQIGASYVLNSNITLYPNFNHINSNSNITTYKFRNLNIQKTVRIGRTIIEFENGIPLSAINDYIVHLNQIYSKIPCLFTPTKVFAMTPNTYQQHSDFYGLTHNLRSPLAYATVDIQYDNNIKKIDKNVIVHELGHTWDSYYKFKTGKRLREQEDFKNYVNLIKYKIDPRYTDESKIGEVWAASVSNYYFHVLKMNDSEGYYALQSGQSLNSSELQVLKAVMENHINISKNW